jgi:hypothetical protein
MYFLPAFLRILEYVFQILQYKFYLFILKINQLYHMHYAKFREFFSLPTNFEFSQKFPVKTQIFLHIEIVPNMYEKGEVKKVLENKVRITIVVVAHF